MKRRSSLLALLLVLALTLGALPALAQEGTDAPTENFTADCPADYDETVNYFPEQVTVDYANAFTVEYFNNYKVVTVPQPWAGAETPVSYVLVQCGTPAPEDEALADLPVIEVPVQSFVSMSTTYLPFLDQLDQVETLVAVDEFDYINTPSVRERIDAEEVAEIGSGPSVNIEILLDLDPDVIMTSSTGSADYDSYPVLQEAGLPVVLNADYTENDPLGRAEWIKFIALFYNQEADAAAIFDTVGTEYNDLVALAASVEAQPTVFVDSSYEGTWYMAGGASYTAQLLADAGAAYVYADDESTASLYLDFESVLDAAAEADFWVNANGFWFAPEDALASDERYAEFAAFQNENIYLNNKVMNAFGGIDYYESGIAQPEVILADLIAIFHPELLPDHELYYYQPLFADAE
jgi:iron complex transport system substrate-binding protein